MRHLRRKLTLRAHGEQVVFVKRKQERIEHVWMKAFLWALYLPLYSDLQVEVDVGEKYKPDVVAVDRRRGRPRFWGEAGAVGPDKIRSLVSQHPGMHLAVAKWDTALDPVRTPVEQAVHETERSAPVDLLRFPDDSADRFLDDGTVNLSFDDLPDAVDWVRVGNAARLP